MCFFLFAPVRLFAPLVVKPYYVRVKTHCARLFSPVSSAQTTMVS